MKLAEQVAARTERGDMSALWDGVRQLSGKKRRAPPALAPVGMNGVPARTTREQAMCWQAKFLEEFGGNGGVVTDAALLEQVRAGRAAVEQAMPAAAQLPQELKQAVLPCSREAWTYALAGAFRGMALRRAPGQDGVPAEFAQAGGLPYAAAVADLVVKFPAEGAPLEWRGGRMSGVPRKAGKPMTWTNIRGVLCSPVPAKAYASVLRSSFVGWLPYATGPTQYGAISGGGSAIPQHLVRIHLANARSRKRSAGVLFLDLRRAFYSAYVAAAVGPVAPAEQRSRLMTQMRIPPEDAAALEQCIVQGDFELAALGVPAKTVRAVVDWHVGTWFSVAAAPGERVQHECGTRPGDPTADAIFAFVLAGAQRDIGRDLRAAQLVPVAVGAAPGIFAAPSQGSPECRDVLPVAFMDDLCVPIEADTPRELVGRLAAAADIARSRFRARGLEVNFAEGKTEAIAAWRGPGRAAALRELRQLPMAESKDWVPLVPLPT